MPRRTNWEEQRRQRPALNTGEHIDAAENRFAGLGIGPRHGDDRAFYAPSTDSTD